MNAETDMADERGQVRLDADGGILAATPALARLLGYDDASSVVALGQITQLTRYPGLLQRARDGQLLSGTDVEWRRRDGTPVVVRLSGGPTGERGEIELFVEDVTEKHRIDLECQLHKLAALGQLAGGIAHNFNNLMTAVIGYADLLDEAPPGSTDHATSLAEIRAAARRATSISRRLLTFAAERQTSAERVDTTAAIQAACGLLTDLLRQDVVLRWKLFPGPLVVRMHLNELEQALIHLILNAQDALPDGGHIQLAVDVVSTLPDEAIPAARSAPDGWVRISVTDDGYGVRSDVRARLLEPFFTTAMPDRVGLGLSVVYGIVCQNGGALAWDFRPAQGARFDLFLPCEPPDSPRSTRSALVLVVDDDEAIASLVKRTLERDGHTVLVAGNAEEATPLLERGDLLIEAMVTDIALPGRSGRWLVEHARTSRPGLGVLFLTGYQHAIPLAAMPHNSAVLMKPFELAALRDAVHDLLGGAFAGGTKSS